MTLEQARHIAGEWHRGQWSALYSFCSTGRVAYPLRNYSDEIMECITHPTTSEKQRRRLRKLRAFIKRMKGTKTQ